MDGSIETLLLYPNFIEGMWILSDYLNVMLLKRDVKIKHFTYDTRYIQMNVEEWKIQSKQLL